MRRELKGRLMTRYGERCPICGATDVPLEIHHIIPRSAGGADEEANLILMCANCNRLTSGRNFTEAEFNHYLADLLARSSEFEDIRLEERLSREKPFRADITARSKDGKTWLIECKNSSSFTPARMDQAISQIESYKALTKFDRYVLAFPGLLSANQVNALSAHGIESWDIKALAKKFKSEVSLVPHPVFQAILSASLPSASKTLEEEFIVGLKACKKGKESWMECQKLIGQILEHLFCPPLETPISELADHEGINRRDWIIPNYADQGFWNFVREKYRADYIVVDAKNYKAAISKSQVLQLANYLKAHGAGMFAMIVTRIGADNGAVLTVREQWMANNKMILVINDEDIEAMLLAKMAGGNPEKIIGQAIERFRLSM
ncbi:HNH endonuclease [Burkholderia gladioli]|uniref:HNH endonuclease n=1 Tax=Burkholderia gladioli TaxID=28095 RepID=UPI0022D04A81|nr:HNH endonuclease [Burkholderia gladioli]MDA0574506.1 HNH endonuclease [Burkholderia gladioli]MDA0602620.1 HNH endonuclease [Burkholderia gladioli]